jgi:hypothetical protein
MGRLGAKGTFSQYHVCGGSLGLGTRHIGLVRAILQNRSGRDIQVVVSTDKDFGSFLHRLNVIVAFVVVVVV